MNTNTTLFAQLDAAASAGKLTSAAVSNIRDWLEKPYFSDYAPLVAEHIEAEKWSELEEAFWTTVPFGTGGRRGRMYPIGCNAINQRTIGETAQGLADYVKDQASAEARGPSRLLACAIAYDTRHRSREFAELCAEIMVEAGFKVYFLDGCRSTPELSFAVRHYRCDCGIIITASHNPPSDNAAKVYGPSGGQFIPPHDEDSIERMRQTTFVKRAPFAEALSDGRIVYCQDETDAAFIRAVLAQSVPGPRDLNILYSPLHGVGASAVMPVLSESGFKHVELFGPHAEQNGDFPNVPNNVANPENPAVFDSMIKRAEQSGAELILATDPDCDRLGCAVRKSIDPGAPWTTLTGNQLGALLADFLLATRREAGTLSPDHYIVKTLVTTELIRRVADKYGVQTAGDLHVGFKWIGAEMDARGPERFVFGTEESYGFLSGDHVRDKDAAVAALLTSELAARLKSEGKTLYQRLDELFLEHGCFSEGQINVKMPGEKGMEDMRKLMRKLRVSPPGCLGGMGVVRVRDYLKLEPRGDLVVIEMEAPGNYVAVRPSGTEPKVKFYLFAYDPPSSADLEATKNAQAARLEAVGRDLRASAGA
ncbi:MAG: phospho-sugar mutase [Pirellulaceae bacterium]|mgnify:CR=1 FL=1|nr:phospho-sugar mutase [Pirellulaceae bacterium]